MASLTRWVLDHKRLVVGLWLVLAIAGLAAMRPAGDALSQQFNLPGREAFIANSRVAEIYGNGGDVAPLVPVVTLPKGRTVDSPGVAGRLQTALAKVKAALPAARLASSASTHDRAFVSHDGRTTFALVSIPAMALVAIPTTFLLVWPLATATDVSVIVKFLIALVGLAIAIDHALLVVVR